MSLFATARTLRVSHSKNLVICANKFHTSAIYLVQKWREWRRLTGNPNSHGPLVTLPDFSYKDNRPTPYGVRQLKRIQEHQNYVKKIVQLVGEVDYAVERHTKIMKEKEEERKMILDNKLKPKGEELLTSK